MVTTVEPSWVDVAT